MGSGSHGADTARTLANPGRTSLHSQPATYIIQVLQVRPRGDRRGAGITPMVMSLLAVESEGHSFSRNRIWVGREAGRPGGSDAYHSTSRGRGIN